MPMTTQEVYAWIALAALTLVVFLAAFAATALVVRQRRYARLVACLAFLIVTFAYLQLIYEHLVPTVNEYYVAAVTRLLDAFLPALGLAVDLLGMAFVSSVFIETARYERSHITVSSIKEAFDSLPTGVSFIGDNGMLLLANDAVQRFSEASLGRRLNAWDNLANLLASDDLERGVAVESTGDSLVATLPDGKVFNVTTAPIALVDSKVQMTLVSDVTAEYETTRELHLLANRLATINERLSRANRELVSTVTEQEIVNARIKVHDELGRILLVIEDYVANGGTPEKLEEIRSWLTLNVAFLKTGFPSREEDDYALLRDTASQLGVQIKIRGALPKEEPFKRVVSTAIHECLTNTIRHAKGDLLEVVASESPTSIVVTLFNNGTQPSAPISETGGLLSLRELVELTGGTMEVVSLPKFSLTITLPKEVNYVV